MGRPKKYQELDIYAGQRAYFETEKGKAAVERYENSERRKKNKRDWQRKRRGTVVDRRQWFIDTYGEIEQALDLLEKQEKEAIQLYYGLSTQKPLTADAIANLWNKSASRFYQIKKSAEEKLDLLKEKTQLH